MPSSLLELLTFYHLWNAHFHIVNEKALLGALCQIDSFTYSSIFLTDKAKTRKNPSITVQWQGTPSDRMFPNASEVSQMVFSKL